MINICGRRVKVVTGTKSQTVNVCSLNNINDEYDYIIRLRRDFVTEEFLQLKKFGSIEEMVKYLEEHHYGDVEQFPTRISKAGYASEKLFQSETINNLKNVTGRDTGNFDNILRESPSKWEVDARIAVEQSIDQFIIEFLEFPYLHRVEHSMHCELFKILSGRKIFASTFPMGRWITQPIHKEWPEYLPRPEKGNRRGNFDICVLSPERMKSSSFQEFREGRIEPSFAIEIGLDYDIQHLKADSAKLINSGVRDSYLIHLVRPEVADNFEAVEQFLLETSIKTAYARLTNSQAFYKLVNDKEIRSVSIG